MRVKIEDKWYDTLKTAIVIELSEKDKLNISRMSCHTSMYASFPEADVRDYDNKLEWMELAETICPPIISNKPNKRYTLK
jgi:hypothetical protein